MYNNLITIIIPFLNEGEEVENTLKSVFLNTKYLVDIILINDSSDDEYDYESVARQYNVKYIKNETRKGVASCRELGIGMITTPYFLLLDAHMRFYNDHWIERIVDELSLGENIVVCCQTRAFRKEDKTGDENITSLTVYGAYINLFFESYKLLDPFWTTIPYIRNEKSCTIPIACILGAGYASSKKYWQYLKGVTGLLFYGSDEPYISIKVWLSGGRCLLLKDVVIGHLYRQKENVPYDMNEIYLLYNRLYIGEVILPVKHKKRLYSELKKMDLSAFNQALFLINGSKKEIVEMKNYYSTILTKPFHYFEKINKHVVPDSIFNKINISKKKVYEFTLSLLLEIPNFIDLGLLNGKMGVIIYLYYYSRYMKNETVNDLANLILLDLISKIQWEMSLNFSTGLTGIGWALDYLAINDYIEGDKNEILYKIDQKIQFIDIDKIQNCNIENGLGGLVLYTLMRLHSVQREERESPFSVEFLFDLYNKCVYMEENQIESNCVNSILEYIKCYEDDFIVSMPSIYDAVVLPSITEFKISYPWGLCGNAGIGLEWLLNHNHTLRHNTEK